MKKIPSILIALVLTVQVVAQTYVVPVAITVGNEQQNSNHGIRAVGGTAYGGPEYNNARNVIRFVQTLSPGQKLSFDINNINNMYAIGLATSNSQTNVYNSPVGNPAMVFGMVVGNNAKAQAYEAGYTTGPSTTLTTNNYLQISYEGVHILYKKSTDGGANFNTYHTSTVTASGVYNIYFEAPPQFAGPHNIYITGSVTNQPPLVNAGINQTIALPGTVANLTGTASDVDGNVTQTNWMKVSGPTGGFVQTPASLATQVTGLTEGTYVYRLTASDNSSATAQDEMSISVIAADPNGSTVISPSIIPFSAPEFNSRGGGGEQWFDHYYVSVPSDDDRMALSAYYWRFAWPEIEVGQDQFDWTHLDAEFNRAIDNKQVFGFGIMTQTASSNWRTGVQMPTADGKQMFYPLYLHQQMQAEASNSRDFVRHDGGEWVPNYNSPNYLARLKNLNKKIYEHIVATSYKGVRYKDVMNYWDIRIVGEWGEWHFNMTAPDPNYWPSGRQPSVASLKKIIDDVCEVVPDIKLVVNFSVYDGLQLPNTWIEPEVGYHALRAHNQWGPIGWRRDQWGFADNGATYVHSWTDQNTRTYGGIRFDTVIMARSDSAPVVGEPPGNWNNYDEPYMANLPKEVKLYKAMSFGNGNFWTDPMYQPDLMTQGSRDSVRMASKLAGPRLQIDSAVMSTQATTGGMLNVKAYWRNAGLCPVYDVFHAKWLIKNQSGDVVITKVSSFKPKWFKPQAQAIPFADQIPIPTDLPAGTYSLSLIIEDSLAYRPPLAIANEGRHEDGSYQLRAGFPVIAGGSNQAPVVTISGRRFVQHPNASDTLIASATDPDGTIASYQWRKAKGPAGGTIGTPTSKQTIITGLDTGRYVFEVVVTDNGGATALDSRVIIVRGTNVRPVAFAGRDQWLYAGTTSTYLTGKATDIDGQVSKTLWSYVSGPSGSLITTPSAISTPLANLVPGDYVFRLTVTDNLGGTRSDEVSVKIMSGAMPQKRVIVKE